MENFPTDIMLFFALILMLFLETGRMFLFRRFKLHLPRQSPWQETYYVRYAFFCFALTPFLTALVSVLSIAWAAISKTHNIYLGGISLVLLTGLVGGLLFVALHRIMPLDKRLVALVIIGTVLDMACFIYKGTRLFFGGTLMVLLTSAVGRPLRFNDWTSLLDWLKQDRAGEEARVTFLVQAQAAVRRDSDGNVSIRTLGVPLPSSPTELLRTNLARHLSLRLARFVQRRWNEWDELRANAAPPPERARLLYLWIQQEFFPSWSDMLGELARIAALLPNQIREQDPTESEDSRKLRVQGILEKTLTPMLLDVTETNLPAAHVTYMNGLAHWLKRRVTDLVLQNWPQLVTWSQEETEEKARVKIERWLAEALLPERKPGLHDLAVLAHTIFTRLAGNAPGGPTSQQAEECATRCIAEQFPLSWLDFVDTLSEQLEAYRSHHPYSGDQWTEQLLDDTRLEMMAQAAQQMGNREDLLRKAARVVSANLDWFAELGRQIVREWDWDQQIIQTKAAEIAQLRRNSADPRTEEQERKIREAFDAIAAARDKIARIEQVAQGRIEQLLSYQLLPRWHHDLHSLAQAIVRILPVLAGDEALLLRPEERLSLVRSLLQQELPSSWQGMLDRITSVLERNLPQLTQLQQEQAGGADVLGSLQDLLKGHLDQWQPENLFHWVYDIPEGSPAATLYLPRVQPFEVKPRVEFDEYLGLFLTYLRSRLQGQRRQRPA